MAQDWTWLGQRLQSGEDCPTKVKDFLSAGGRANDLPGVGYTAVRGVYDFSPVVGKRKRRSVYGVSRPSGFTNHVRRCFRK